MFFFFFLAEGFCSECKAILKINLFNELYSEPIYLEILAENVNFKITHNDKRQLVGPKRKKVKEELLNRIPRQWQRTEAGKNMDYNDPKSPQLHNLSSLEKARSDSQHKKLGIKKGLKLGMMNFL